MKKYTRKAFTAQDIREIMEEKMVSPRWENTEGKTGSMGVGGLQRIWKGADFYACNPFFSPSVVVFPEKQGSQLLVFSKKLGVVL